MPPFAIVDRDGEGAAAVLMIVDEQYDAEKIASELRQANVRVDVLPLAPRDDMLGTRDLTGERPAPTGSG